MDTTSRLFALAHLLWPDCAWDVRLRADGPRVTASAHSADAAGDDVPMARVVADDGVSALDALAVSLCRLASARARDLLAATGAPLDETATLRAADLAHQRGASERALAEVTRERDALRRRVDQQPAGGAVGVGAGVDLGVWVRRSAVRGLCRREGALYGGRLCPEAIALGIVGNLVADGVDLPSALRGQPDRGADEGEHPSERGAEVVRVVIGEGAILRGCWYGTLGHGERLSVRADGLTSAEGQRARLVVEVVGHAASIATSSTVAKARAS